MQTETNGNVSFWTRLLATIGMLVLLCFAAGTAILGYLALKYPISAGPLVCWFLWSFSALLLVVWVSLILEWKLKRPQTRLLRKFLWIFFSVLYPVTLAPIYILPAVGGYYVLGAGLGPIEGWLLRIFLWVIAITLLIAILYRAFGNIKKELEEIDKD